jgi:hypothetical protein
MNCLEQLIYKKYIEIQSVASRGNYFQNGNSIGSTVAKNATVQFESSLGSISEIEFYSLDTILH